jgi:hypothetical protein
MCVERFDEGSQTLPPEDAGGYRPAIDAARRLSIGNDK